MLKKIAILSFAALILFPMFSWTTLIQTELSYNPRNAKGTYSFVSYLGDVGQINLVNGNLMLGRSLVSRPGRNGFNLEIGIHYNSKIWDRSGANMVVKEPGSWVGLGWRLEFPKLVQGTSSYAIVASDGSSHEIEDFGGGVWKSVDSSYTLLDPSTKVATLKGGVKLIFGNTVGSTSYLTELKDRNGNQILVTYLSGTGKINTVTDTLGTAATFSYNTDGTLASITSCGQYVGQITFAYSETYFSPSFSIPSQIPSGEKLLRSITIKNAAGSDLVQLFGYNSYGELSGVSTQVNEYGYDEEMNYVIVRSREDPGFLFYYKTLNFYDQTYGSVEERLVYNFHKVSSFLDGLGNTCYSYITWVITYDVNATKSNPALVTVQDTYGKTEYTFNYTNNGRNWSDGMVQRIQRKTLAGLIKMTNDTSWTEDQGALPSYPVDPRIASQLTTLDNNLTTRTDYTYTSDGTGNIYQVAQYGFSGSLLRTTTTTYWHESNPSYAALNLTNLVASVSITDNQSGEISRTETRYDESSLISYGSVPNHDLAYGTSYTTRGNPTTVQRRYIEGSRFIASTIQYDIAGNAISQTDPKSNTTTTVYEPARNYAFPKTVTNPLSHVTEYDWKSVGNLHWLKDPNGVTVSHFSYDNFSRKISEETAAGETKTFIYDDVAYLATVSSSSGWGYTTADTHGNTIQTQKSDPGGQNIVQSQTIDGWGAAKSVSVPYRYGSGGASTSYTYDSLHRLLNINPATGGQISYSYSGNEITVTNQEGKRKKYTYNEDSKIIKVTEEDASGNLTVETTYQYDILGRLLSVTQGVQTRTFVYDSLGRLTSETHPESGTTSYTYDDNGNMLTKTDARNVTTTMTYDVLNRMLTRTYSDNTPSDTFSYDQTTSDLIPIITNGKGRQTSAWTSDNVGYSWSYDEAGRPLNQMFRIDGTSYPISYSYTESGCSCTKSSLVSITVGTETTTYTRDSISRITAIDTKPNSSESLPIIHEISYASFNGSISKIQYPTDLADKFTYWDSGRLQSISLDRMTYDYSDDEYPYFRHSIYKWNYSFGNAGRINQIEMVERSIYSTSINSNERGLYAYDQLNRLSSRELQNYNFDTAEWESISNNAYSYDQYGNISGTANSSNNRLTSYNYDSAGNQFNDAANNYTYDGRNLIKQATRQYNGTQVGLYRYDSMGRRVKKSWNYIKGGISYVGSSIYLYGVGGEILWENKSQTTNGNSEYSSTLNYYMGSKMVARHTTGYLSDSTVVDKIEWLHRNHRNEVVAQSKIDLSKTTWNCDHPYAWHIGYYSCDATVSKSGNAWAIFNESGGSDQFPGHKVDEQTGLKDFGARYYNPTTMRWNSADSLTAHIYDPQSLNKYAYVRNDPVNAVDPDGLDTVYIMPDGGSVTVTAELPQAYTHLASLSGAGSRGHYSPLLDVNNGDGGGGNGGLRTGFIGVSNPSKTGWQQDRIRSVLDWIKDNVGEDCAKWLGNDLAQNINLLLGDSADPSTAYIAHGNFSVSQVAAFIGGNSSTTDLPAGYAAIVVNDSGAFFSSNFLVNGYTGGTSQAQAEILIHELAHLLLAPGFQSDFGNLQAGRANDQLVTTNCGSTINAAKKIP